MSYLDTLAESLYLTPSLPEAEVEAALKRLGLSFPLLLAVGRAEDEPATRKVRKRGDESHWSPHPGLVYILQNKGQEHKASSVPAGELRGEIFECDSPGRFVGILLNAVVSFRRRELQEFLERQPRDLSLAAELDARRLAHRKILLASVRNAPGASADWHSAVELWLDIVLLRHQRHLHTLRRKLHEFLSLLSCDFDRGNMLGNRYSLAQRFVQETYSVRELRTGFLKGLSEMVAELPGQIGSHSETLSPFCRQAVEWLEQHYSEPVSVADCAAAIHLNASYLSRLFRKETGRTVVQHLQQLRIDHARELLQQRRHTVRELAGLCGFGSAEHFHRVFHRHTGMTPAQYRRNHRTD